MSMLRLDLMKQHKDSKKLEFRIVMSIIANHMTTAGICSYKSLPLHRPELMNLNVIFIFCSDVLYVIKIFLKLSFVKNQKFLSISAVASFAV